MKEIYGWVPWFQKLAQKLVAGERDFLTERAKKVAWKSNGDAPSLLKYGDENIDPFSFFYSIVERSSGAGSRRRIYPSISKEFGISDPENLDRDETFIFPTPPRDNVLFHNGRDFYPDLLWNLFRDAVSGVESMDPGRFDRALKIPNVSITKLTQALFLVNSEEFLPLDKTIRWLGISDSTNPTRSRGRNIGRSWIGSEARFRNVCRTRSTIWPAC